MDPLKRPTRKQAPPPELPPAIGAFADQMQAAMAQMNRALLTITERFNQTVEVAAPQVSVATPSPVIVPAPTVHVDAPIVNIPDTVTVSNDWLNVYVGNAITLDEETITALKAGAAATKQVAQAYAGGGGGMGQMLTKLTAMNVTLEGILLASGGSIAGKASLLDYDIRTDGNPIYVGEADQGTATADPAWVVKRLTYDGSARLTDKQEFSDVAWDDRAILGWAAY